MCGQTLLFIVIANGAIYCDLFITYDLIPLEKGVRKYTFDTGVVLHLSNRCNFTPFRVLLDNSLASAR